MKIKILKNTILAGVYVKAGEIVDASDKDAAILIGYRKAEAYEAAEQPVAPTEPTGDDLPPEVEQAPAVAKPSKKKK